ncbi:MAG: aminofutalosine synthase MqnE [Planctomycetes bacterium]|nr:aminofutalosine synthase MqnE [Planctomycetota bacterium]MCW8134825.1 aminofutalosine synthase MqnE [Planctomycetota bacterium]
MNTLVAASDIADLVEKVEAGQRLNPEDGLRLFATRDIAALGYAANLVRERLHGDVTTYIVNRYLHYSNVCWDTCKFCSFYRKPGEPGSFTRSVPEIIDWARRFEGQGVQELHIVGGLHPSLKYDYYLDLLRGLKTVLPGTSLKGFTAVEVDWFARIARKDARTVMRDLHDAGLDSLTGGGAEIFAEHVRKLICPNKIDAARYFEIHGIAHEMGLKTQVTMLYGHIESDADRVDHLLRVRDHQDRTNGFQVFIPLAYHPENNALKARRATGMTDLKVYAVSRLMLDNVPHIKCYWISAGLKLAQVALSHGVDDLDGIVYEHERIFHDAGSATPQQLSEDALRKMITDAGRTPCRRDARYRLLEAVGAAD